jgi:FkbM family methyltransferase
VIPPPTTGFALANGAYGAFEGCATDRVVFGTYQQTGSWSPGLVALIAERLFAGGGGTLLDVGANIGLVTIPVLERCQASCVAFEPEPTNHELLRRNLLRHGLAHRVETHALALDANAGEVGLLLSRDNSGDHRLCPQDDADQHERIQVRAARLDDVLAGHALEHPVVLKIDSQGAEVRVLAGAQQTLAQVDYLVVEYWPAGLLRMGDSAAALQQALTTFPYATLLRDERPPDPLQDTTALFARLAWIPTDGSDEGFFDLLLARDPELTTGSRTFGTRAPR